MDRRRLLLITAAVPVAALVGPGRAAAGPDPGGDGPPPPPPLAPPLTVTFEPIEGTDAVYLPLVPITSADPETAKLILRLTITNTGSTDLTIKGISFAFPGSGVPTVYMQGVDLVLGDGGVIAAGQSKVWSNGSVTLADSTPVKNQVYLPVPVPPTVRVNVGGVGYPALFQTTATLAPFQIAHRFPYDANDLRNGEFVNATGDHWSNGGPYGTQIYAHDVGVLGWDNETSSWSGLLPGTDGSQNEHYRVWNMPLRAVADGLVISAYDGLDDNTVLGQFPSPTPNPGGGNNVWVEFPDGTEVWYTHMKKGSVAVAAGDTVVAGQLIGHVGNSGNTTAPHTHLEVRRTVSGSPLRPWALTDAWMVSQNAGTPWNADSDLWVPADNRGIPNTSMLIWPSPLRPHWYKAKIREFIDIDFPPHDWWTIVDRAAGCGYEPVHFGTYAVGEKVFSHAAFRPASGSRVQTRSGLTASEYAELVDRLRADGYRPVTVTSYVDGEDLRYAGIWRQEKGPEWTGYHAADLASHREQMASLAAKGYVPNSVSVAAVRAVPEVTAWYTRAEVGEVSAPLLLSSSEYAKTLAENARTGLQLVHVSTCQIDGETRFSAVFHEKASGSGETATAVGLDRAALLGQQDRRADAGELLRTASAYVVDSTVVFTAAWRGEEPAGTG